MAIHILDDPIAIDTGDVVLIGTNAGTTVQTVQTAMIARSRGATSVALTPARPPTRRTKTG
jgi:DNA-binding MurR/RpiR family transcriptional regulator